MSKHRNGQNSNTKPTESCEYHVRTLKFHEQKCAYHAGQLITNFCKSEECLLPVCPTCIKLHSDEHKMHKTASNFEEITKVVAEIEGVYGKMNELAERVKQLLVDIEGNKKDNEAKIRARLVEHRNILIRQFEQSLLAIEDSLIAAIVSDDRLFIQEIEAIDEQLCRMQLNLRKDDSLLHSDDLLKHIILYYSKLNGENYQRDLERLKRRSEDLVKKSIVVTVDEGELAAMSKAVSRYMNIEITDWAATPKK